ncbi:MAG: sialidase family protein [Planctomycetota bacterium]|nr:sialidase family protein [Planctomycetota bacterium]
MALDADSRIYDLAGLRVRVSAPTLVGRSRGFLWFPTLARFGNGTLLATMSTLADVPTNKATARHAWSGDDGRTWSPLNDDAMYGDVNIPLSATEEIILPYYLFPREGGAMGATALLASAASRRLETLDPGMHIAGMPRPQQSHAPEFGICGFVCNGQAVKLNDGSHLTTLYGHFQGDKRYNLVAIVSKDGLNWQFRSIVDGADSPIAGDAGPCESALCRLKDGRLMIVYRVGTALPFGQAWSSDEGKTWTRPVAMSNAFSVQPSLATFADGTLALSGGRHGLFLWLDPTGLGEGRWRRLSLEEHHNMTMPGEPFDIPGQTTAYSEIVRIGPTSMLCIYDRIPFGWAAIPADFPQDNSAWVVRIDLA